MHQGCELQLVNPSYAGALNARAATAENLLLEARELAAAEAIGALTNGEN